MLGGPANMCVVPRGLPALSPIIMTVYSSQVIDDSLLHAYLSKPLQCCVVHVRTCGLPQGFFDCFGCFCLTTYAPTIICLLCSQGLCMNFKFLSGTPCISENLQVGTRHFLTQLDAEQHNRCQLRAMVMEGGDPHIWHLCS